MKPLALVTGGCRRLGAVIAARLADEGYELALQGRRDAEPEAALRRVLDARGTRWAAFEADFTDGAAPERLFAAVEAAFGRAPDLLINGASLFGGDRMGEATSDDLMQAFAVDAAAPALLIQALARATGDGRAAVVNLLDQRLVQPHGDQFSYTLAKYALAGLTRIAARTLAPALRVNAVAPGLTVPTEAYAAGQAEAVAARTPLQTMVAPAAVADAVLYLARAEAVTGQTIFVDAGARFVSFDRDFVGMTA